MGRTAIVALLVVVAGAGFWVGRSTGATTTKTEVTPSPVVKQTATDRIPDLCDDTMRFALATWQQMSDAPFANEVKAYQASRSGSLEQGAAQQDLAAEAAKLWATYGKNGGHSPTVAQCLRQWLHQQPGAAP